jgi:YVTN family beta-propeller protein
LGRIGLVHRRQCFAAGQRRLVHHGKQDNTVSVIDATTRTVTATVPVKFAHGVAVDPGSHTVYVTNSAGDTVTVIESR